MTRLQQAKNYATIWVDPPRFFSLGAAPLRPMPSQKYHPEILLTRLGPDSPPGGRYAFQLYRRDDPNSPTGTYYSCTIPGKNYTKDGPRDPEYPEQEAWMRRHSGLKEVWHVTFETTEASEMDAFIARLKRLRDSG